MRFTRIPIIATLLAGALSLLFLLPALGQTTGDLERTEGRERSGALEVGVFSSVADAQEAKLKRVAYIAPGESNPTRVFYQAASSGDTDTTISIPAQIGDVVASGVVGGTLRKSDDPAFLVRSPEVTEDPNTATIARIDIPGNYVETQNTSFNGSLYVGSKKSADPEGGDFDATGEGGYNTALISFFMDEAPAGDPCAATALPNYPVAVVSNPSRGYDIEVPLFPTSTTETVATGSGDGVYVQSFFMVADDTQDDDDLPDNDRERDGPHCSVDTGSGVTEFGQIAARHGDRLTVRIANEASNIALIVDAEGPEISLISPVDGSSVKPNSLSFRFDVRDPDSGLRHDGEFTLSGDGDPASINPDRDAVRGGEPLSEMTSSLFSGGNGKAADIQAVFWKIDEDQTDAENGVGTRLELPDADRSDDITDQGAWSLIGSRAGVGYSFAAQGNNFAEDVNALQLQAMDRVGNTTTSDADLEKIGDQPYVFSVDATDPSISEVRTGISYDNGDNEEIVDRAAIALEFNEPIKSGDIVASRITVIGNSVVGVIQPDGEPIVFRGEENEVNLKPKNCTLDEEVDDPESTDDEDMIPNPNKCPGADIEGDKIVDTRTLVYLQLGSSLTADATPDVSLLSGAVQDLAGNDIGTTTRKAEDWIAPTLMVTVTGTKGDRPIANDDGEFVVEVTSDEDLSGRPRVIFAQIIGVDNEGADPPYSYSIGERVSALADCTLTPQETDNMWRRACGVGEQIRSASGDITGMVGVFVLAIDDENKNLAVSPVKWEDSDDRSAPGHQVAALSPSILPGTGAAVDAKELHDAGLLVEIDTVFNADMDEEDNSQGAQMSPDESVTPQSGDDEKKTESANPFIHIDFTGENAEYGLGDYKDSHGTVTITEIKLNDEDATDQLSRVAKDEFSVVLRDLPVGKHTLTYKAEDDAGNEYNNGEFKFEVLQRKPYKVEVKPGWNLISLPGAPENTAIADVLSGTEFLTPVLAYQNGDWRTARRTEDGDGWDGSLTDIEAGYGYWVHAQTFETIETLLTEIDPASVPPTVPVARGWNLLGVIDVDQRSAGNPPGTGRNADGEATADGEADNYFNSIPWKVAYSYDTQASVWKRYTPDDDETDAMDEILNGNGYWVWSERPSTLVP